jgi:hypothetical protein
MRVIRNTAGKVATAAVIAIALATGAHAQVVSVGSQADFSALGTASQSTNFDAYPTDGSFSLPGSPFSVGDLSFVAGGENLIGGTGSYGFARNLITDNYVQGTTIQIDGVHDLFALNAGNFFSTGNATFSLTTNLGSYQFVETVTDGAQGFSFFGFQAGAGEYFTSFNVSGSNATGMTDIQLAQAVPEPETYALMLAGLGVVCFVARRQRR